MNRTIAHNDLAILSAGLAKAGLEVSGTPTETCMHAVYCSYINNPNGSLRWIWPAHSLSASFLRFYHTGGRKARIRAFAMHFCVTAGLGRLIGQRSCTLYVSEHCAHVIGKIKDWALFTGTVGENRKLVVWYADEKGSFFVKMPLSPASERNIGNEVVGTSRVHSANIVKPWSRVVNSAVIVQPDIYSAKAVTPASEIMQLPLRSVVEWAGSGSSSEMINTSGWWLSIEKRMSTIAGMGNIFSPVLISRIKETYNTIWKHTRVMMAEAHGDFTPWNVRHDGHKLYMIDWEMYTAQKPVLYDIFHYIYQGNILVKRAPYKAIRAEVNEYLALPGIKTFLEANEIDAALAEKLYLLDVITYYMEIYSRQQQWHTQVGWLLQTWCEALGHVLQVEGQLQPRQALVQDMVHFLHNSRYAVLKLQQEDLTLLPTTSDVDICMEKGDAVRLRRWLRTHLSVSNIHCLRLSFMERISLVLEDNSFLHLDLIWKLKRKSTVFMDAAEVLESAQANVFGVKVPALLTDMRYTWLFHLLNGASVPEKHAKKWMEALRLRQDESATNIVAYSDILHKKVQADLHQSKENTGSSRMLNTGTYLWDTLKGLIPRKGLFITFSGVDGAGKSTIIGGLSKRIEKELRTPVVVLRHRPSILPILSAWRYGKKSAELRSVRAMPRTGNNRSSISSYFRFAYYYSDYLLGQFYVHIRYVWQGYTVLYDRYYFDFINDAKRSNIVIPERATKWLYRFLLKPDLNYFLFAPAGIILQRKQELDEDSINDLTQRYMRLFGELRKQDSRHGYHTICNLDLKVTLDKIFTGIKKERSCAA